MALLNKLPNRLARHRSGLPSHFAPGFKQCERGNRIDVKPLRQDRQVFRIYLGDQPAPLPSEATLTNSGATILHGPHHGAQNSTSTGRAERLAKHRTAFHSSIQSVPQESEFRRDTYRNGRSPRGVRRSADYADRIAGRPTKSRDHRVQWWSWLRKLPFNRARARRRCVLER
jgi:hypothetical protein